MALDFNNTTNTGLLNNIMKKTNQEKDSIVTLNIDINLIDKNPDNASIFNMDDVDYLADGMKEDGFYGAIEVFKKKDGRYEISAGHRRYLAAIKNGMKTIPCMVIEDTDDVSKAKRLLSSNIRNRKLSPLDMARCIEYYKSKVLNKEDYTGRKRDAIAKFFNISATQVHRYEALLKIIKPLQELANDPAFSYTSFANAVSLTKEEQTQLYEIIVKFHEENPDALITAQRIDGKIKELKRRSVAIVETDTLDNKNVDDLQKIDKSQESFFKEPVITPEKAIYTVENSKREFIPLQDEDTNISFLNDVVDTDENLFQKAIEKPISYKKDSIDVNLKICANKVSNMLLYEIFVDDKDDVKKSIKELENAISVIKKYCK